MLNLRIDPWDPGYGASVEMEDPAESDASVVFGVEDVPWQAITPPPLLSEPRCAFVDGIRRIDLRLFAEFEGQDVPALAGSWAVGAAWNTKPPRIDRVQVGREIILGGGVGAEALEVQIGQLRLSFRGSSVPEATLLAPQQQLQNHMREAEGHLAQRIFEEGLADLLVLDGPLPLSTMNGPVLGFIKRQSRVYLPLEKSVLLPRLLPGSRTPLFQIGDSSRKHARYSWYTRIARGRTIDGFMTGIVRCEVFADVGSREAVRLANEATALFPRFASQSWHDPRAPQNLYPVGQLEAVLRHRLGDALLLRRGLETTLFRRLPA